VKKEEWQIGDVPLQTEASMRAVLSEQAERVRRQSIALGFATIVVFFVVLAVAVLLGSGCSTARTGTVSENSPHLVSATLTSGSDLTESSQFVQVVLTFAPSGGRPLGTPRRLSRSTTRRCTTCSAASALGAARPMANP